MQLYVLKDGNTLGPLSEDQVGKAMLDEGRLQPQDYAYHEGLPEWTSLQTMLGERLVALPRTEALHEPISPTPNVAVQTPGPVRRWGIMVILLVACFGTVILMVLWSLGRLRPDSELSRFQKLLSANTNTEYRDLPPGIVQVTATSPSPATSVMQAVFKSEQFLHADLTAHYTPGPTFFTQLSNGNVTISQFASSLTGVAGLPQKTSLAIMDWHMKVVRANEFSEVDPRHRASEDVWRFALHVPVDHRCSDLC